MATISISDLPVSSEEYLTELDNSELAVKGGLPWVIIGIAVACALLLEHD